MENSRSESAAAAAEAAEDTAAGDTGAGKTGAGETGAGETGAGEPGASAAAEEETAAGEDPLAQVRRKLLEDAAEFKARLTIYSVTSYQNDKGETITRLLLDAQLKIAALGGDGQNNGATAQEEAESLNLVA